MFECVINVSEGRDAPRLSRLDVASGASLRDRHSDTFHHRSVFTLINEAEALVADVRSLIEASLDELDLTGHVGVHPRLGVVDVVPFVALETNRAARACALRDETAQWLAAAFSVPCFLYGPVGDHVRTLPEIRRRAFRDLVPDVGPPATHPRWGATAVGCRPLLVAWNLWLEGLSLKDARSLAAALRRPALRTLALPVGGAVQISCNLIDVSALRLSQVYDEILAALPPGARVQRAELVGLAPAALLALEDPARLGQLGLSSERTIESRL